MKQVLKRLLSLRLLSLKEHFIYWILPLIVTLMFLIMYSFGTHWMQDFVSPGVNREYGFMENMQALILAGVVYFSFKCFLSGNDVPTRLIYGIATLLSVFIFLEEIDYGITYYELIFNVSPENRAVARSLHGGNYQELIKMKYTMYLFIMFAFVLLPLIEGKWMPVFIRKFIPSVKIILCAASLEIVSLASTFFIYQLGYAGNKSLDINVTEFGECIIYYTLLIYMMEMYRRARFHPAGTLAQRSDSIR